MKEGRVTVEIDGIKDAFNRHEYEYDDDLFVQRDAALREAVSNLWRSGARVENIEAAVAGALDEELG